MRTVELNDFGLYTCLLLLPPLPLRLLMIPPSPFNLDGFLHLLRRNLTVGCRRSLHSNTRMARANGVKEKQSRQRSVVAMAITRIASSLTTDYLESGSPPSL